VGGATQSAQGRARSVTRGPRVTAGGRERREAQGTWAGPERKRRGLSPKEQEYFRFIQMNFKLV
jgi:hypothetical protein